MPSTAQVSIHPSQFPDVVRRELVESLRRRELNHKFLYDGLKQTQKWLALHEACSPARTDPDCASIYDQAFRAAAARLRAEAVHLVGLGCGGGQKDARCLRLLVDAGKQVSYTPVDVSAAMVLTARECALGAVPGLDCRPLVCDLGVVADLARTVDALAAGPGARLVTFFGMMPNFQPDLILPRLVSLLRPDGLLLVSANLAPGPDYAGGMKRLLPLYDNSPTREWLWSFLSDLGLERGDGELLFGIEDGQAGLKRIAARFLFSRTREIQVDRDRIRFRKAESLGVFFSYRHTPALVRQMLLGSRLHPSEQWVTASQEEGIFLVDR